MADSPPEIFDPMEDCPWCSPREILARYGYSPLPPSELDARQLPGRLWELLYAAAARRFFFCFTNHLDDRSLYVLLSEQWLDESTADIPLDAETNTTVIISEFNFGGLTHEEIWLRYYADKTDRELLHSAEKDSVLPLRENPPYDRDRFLPTPPIPPESHAGWLPGDEDPIEESVPLPPSGIDSEFGSTKSESSPDASSSDSPNSPLEAQLRASEPENWMPPARQLTEQSVALLPPAEITDEMLASILWELLHNLALRGFYVLHTNHLTDSELYAELWERGLRDPAHLPGRSPRGAWFHDVLGSWGEDEMQLWLRYYASDDERAKHAKSEPTQLLPPKERPPANRDWRLPKGPF